MTDAAATQNDFRVVPLPHYTRGNRWRTEAMRSYGQPILLWFTKGQGRITVSGVTRGYGPHNAVFIPAGTMHGFDMLGQVHGSVVYFPYGADIDLPEDPVHLRFREAAQHAELSALIDNIQREAERDLAAQDQALLHYGGLLSVWLRRQLEKHPESEDVLDASRRLAAAYSALVERDFHLAKSVSDYAADLGISPTHLSRVCNLACGRSALSILTERKHYEARRMLAETKAPVKDIAEHLGFTSAAYFTRAFQNHAGQTPSAFRKSV